jgi:hypothetical protein
MVNSVRWHCRHFPAIPAAALRTHIDRKFYRWIEAIYLEILTDEEWGQLRAHLEMSAADLTAAHRKGYPTCNPFFLAQHLLPRCFPASESMDWDGLTRVISQADGKTIKTDYIQKYWHEECRPTLGRIARQQVLEYAAN